MKLPLLFDQCRILVLSRLSSDGFLCASHTPIIHSGGEFYECALRLKILSRSISCFAGSRRESNDQALSANIDVGCASSAPRKRTGPSAARPSDGDDATQPRLAAFSQEDIDEPDTASGSFSLPEPVLCYRRYSDSNRELARSPGGQPHGVGGQATRSVRCDRHRRWTQRSRRSVLSRRRRAQGPRPRALPRSRRRRDQRGDGRWIHASTGSYVLSLAPRKIFDELGAWEGIELLERNPRFFAPFPDGSSLTYWNDHEKWLDRSARSLRRTPTPTMSMTPRSKTPAR